MRIHIDPEKQQTTILVFRTKGISPETHEEMKELRQLLRRLRDARDRDLDRRSLQARQDVEWGLDGLHHSRNSVVQLSAIAVAIPCSWLAVEMKKAREQGQVVEEIQRLGGRIVYDYEDRPGATPVPPGLIWLQTLLHEEFFADVVGVAGAQLASAVSQAKVPERRETLGSYAD